MKKLLVLSLLLVSAIAKAQSLPPTPPIVSTNTAGFFSQLSGWLMSNDESLTNLYSPKEVSIKLGGVYSQNSGEAGALISIGQVGLISENVGFGLSIVEKNTGTAAFWGYLSYRKPIGNVCASVFAGVGFDKERSAPLGVVGGEVEYRVQKHIGTYVSLGYAIEDFNNKSSNGRGLVLGAGVKYNF